MPPLLLQKHATFIRRLHSWYQTQHRKLPWRGKPSLYKTVVSEFMLQQTQVETVLPYFKRWMEAFPDFRILSRASSEKVLKHWEGLGYYSRARNLHRLAQMIVGLKRIPHDARSWMKLPGVGPYTAAAITSIAFNAPEAVIDGNVVRVLSRLTANRSFKDNADAVKQLRPVANALLDRGHSGDHNQALMELGATLCLRKKPRCLVCPVRNFCAAFCAGNPEDFPQFKKRKIECIQTDRLWVIHDQALLLQRAPKRARRLSEIYELPRREILQEPEETFKLVAVKQRSISNQRIQERIFGLKSAFVPVRRFIQADGLDWVPLNRLNRVILSGPHRRWIAELLNGG